MLPRPGIFAPRAEWDAYNAQFTNAANNASAAVQGFQSSAQGAIGASTGAAQAGVTSAQAAAQNALAAQAANAGQVSMINTAAEQVQGQAANVSAIAGGMAGDASALRGDAGTLRQNAGALWGQGQQWFGTGQDLVNLNPAAGGLAGEWAKYYQSLSPESLVSFAASDAQRSIDNTRGQLTRTLSGMGVSPGSAAFGAALAKARQYESALLAGVKSRARLLGIKEQGNAISQGMQMAINATSLGQDFANAAVSATSQAANAQGQAANVEAARGGLEAQAGQLMQGAGNLLATGAGITTQSANAVTAAQNAVTGAYGNLAQAQQTAAQYYAQQASSVLGLLQSGNSVALASLFS